MTVEQMKVYQNRITQASKEQLLIITYELFIEEMTEAIKALDQGEQERFNLKMVRVHKFHRELTDNLDMTYELSRDLMSLYIYMNRKLIQASLRMEKEPLIEVLELAQMLLEGFKTASLEGNAETLVRNAQKVYAGLTYGKGTLNETVLGSTKERGFKA